MKIIKKKIKEYFSNLFDFSFKNFITLEVLRAVYWIDVVLGGALAGLTVWAGFQQSLFLGVLAAIVSPVIFIVYVVILRVILETVAVVFRIAEYIKQIASFWEDDSGSKKRITIERYEVEDDEENK